MIVFEFLVALLLGGAALAAMARKIGAPYPALVALAGAALALLPGIPTITLDPQLALALFVAPVLVDAAFDASPRDLRSNWRGIASLALGAVVLTIIAVAIVARMMVPDLPWAAAIALGAIVAPPDAAAATTVLKQLRPPHRLLTILEGESLFNDASALLVYRLAVAAIVTGTISGFSIVPTLLLMTVGSVVLGLLLSRVTLALNARVKDLATAVVIQFCTTFGVWLLAERMHLSGIITMVVFAMATSRKASAITPARIRIPAWAFWEVAVFVLNLFAFVLVGLQLKLIAERAPGEIGWHYLTVASVICFTVILARIVWVFGAVAFSRWRNQRKNTTETLTGKITTGGATVVAWCGMRGTVTLAAALALPSNFPHRDLILTTAFGVTLGTLILQGLSLKPLLLRLRLEDDDSVDREIRLARLETLRAARQVLSSAAKGEATSLVQHSYELQLQRAENEFAGRTTDGKVINETPESEKTSMLEDHRQGSSVLSAANEAQRKRLMALRAEGIIGDAAFQRVEEEIDWEELGWAQIFAR